MSRFAAALVLAAVVGACKPAPPPAQLDPAAEVIARQFYEDVRAGADLSANVHLAHELKNPTSAEQLALFRGLIPNEPARSIQVESWDAKTEAIGTTTRLTIDYGYGDRTVVAQTALFKSPGGQEPVIVGFQVSSKAAAG